MRDRAAAAAEIHGNVSRMLENHRVLSTPTTALLERLNVDPGAIASEFVPRENTRDPVEPQSDEYTASRARIAQLLQLYNVKENTIAPDGNCQFGSIADQLFPLYKEKHGEYMFAALVEQVRNAVCVELEQKRDLYEGFVMGSYDAYVSRMHKNGEWGDHVTLQAAANAFHVMINLLTTYRSQPVIEVMPIDGFVRKMLWLTFYAEVHYNSVIVSSEEDAERQKLVRAAKERERQDNEHSRAQRRGDYVPLAYNGNSNSNSNSNVQSLQSQSQSQASNYPYQSNTSSNARSSNITVYTQQQQAEQQQQPKQVRHHLHQYSQFQESAKDPGYQPQAASAPGAGGSLAAAARARAAEAASTTGTKQTSNSAYGAHTKNHPYISDPYASPSAASKISSPLTQAYILSPQKASPRLAAVQQARSYLGGGAGPSSSYSPSSVQIPIEDGSQAYNSAGASSDAYASSQNKQLSPTMRSSIPFLPLSQNSPRVLPPISRNQTTSNREYGNFRTKLF